MRNRFWFILAICLSIASSAYTQDSDRPWMKGSEHIPVKPANPEPVVKMIISDEKGVMLPQEVTEDVPMIVTANSDIFFDDPITKSISDTYEFDQSQWIDKKAKALWFINDWANNKSYRARTNKELSLNQMEIVPTNPTEEGAISCFCSRKMSYVREDGRKIYCYATSSDMRGFKVKDITPPTCGLDITVVDGLSGRCWPVENPPNHYPLPKTADMYFSGSLFDASDDAKLVSGFELGGNMIVSKEDGGINLKKTDVIKVKVIGDDNYKLDTEKLRYGICAGAGGEPTPVSPVNAEEIDFSTFLIPENPFLYLDASDTAGNREILYIPLNFE